MKQLQVALRMESTEQQGLKSSEALHTAHAMNKGTKCLQKNNPVEIVKMNA